jgi:putative intracellular protease/amidase
MFSHHANVNLTRRSAFTVRDGRYVSARWPGDAYLFARRFCELLTPASV